MRLPLNGPTRFARKVARSRIRDFKNAASGAVAIEFALVSIPFFALLFAIIETALMFFAGQILDSSTASAARLIRTGEASVGNMTLEQFKTKVCEGMAGFADCNSYLKVYVQAFNTFSQYTAQSPINSDGTFKTESFVTGQASQIIVVRAYYQWPVYFNMLGQYSNRTVNGRILLGSVIAFQTEPFPS